MYEFDNCPNCKVSLIGDPIPDNLHKYYSPPYNYRREIGIEYPSRYDGVWEFFCPDCKHSWLSPIAKLKAEV